MGIVDGMSSKMGSFPNFPLSDFVKETTITSRTIKISLNLMVFTLTGHEAGPSYFKVVKFNKDIFDLDIR